LLRSDYVPEHKSCRICAEPLPAPFFDLGMMPLANSFRSSADDPAPEPRFPLSLAACRACGLVQLTFVVPAPTLYRDYIYVSSTSDGVRAHASALASQLTDQYRLTSGDLVVEVASNDGTVLKTFQERGLTVLGIEPARNIAGIAAAAGVPTVPEFFNHALAVGLADAHGPAAVILARHVFAHVDDVHDFLEGAARLLSNTGVLVIEVPYLWELLRNLEFDTVYHEHLSYFALSHFVRLCAAHGLTVVDVDRIGLHGGSIVVHIRKAPADASESVRRMLETEAAAELWSDQNLRTFTRKIAAWKSEFESMIQRVADEGGVLVGYGAAAKGNTLLNYCADVARRLVCILDRSTHKHGRFTPGTHKAVHPVDRWREIGATHLVILAWNFKDEIMWQMQPFADSGGRFIIPLPAPPAIL
jgi:SAM-dependent methyltransferase